MPAGRLLIGLAVWWRTTYRPGGQFSARSFESVAILASPRGFEPLLSP